MSGWEEIAEDHYRLKAGSVQIDLRSDGNQPNRMHAWSFDCQELRLREVWISSHRDPPPQGLDEATEQALECCRRKAFATFKALYEAPGGAP